MKRIQTKFKKWVTRRDPRGTPLWKSLIFQQRLPQRIRIKIAKRLWNFNNKTTTFDPKEIPKYPKEDITVIIGLKNRCDHRIINYFKSIRNQDYDQKLINIKLIDYDSKKRHIRQLKQICKKYNAEYTRVENKPIWNRSHCLNIGIKRTNTKYILASDVDIIFNKNYIQETVKILQKDPFQVIISDCFWLKKLPAKQLNSLNFKKVQSSLIKSEIGYGIALTLTYFFKKIRGYDERVQLWGGEDKDIIKRLSIKGVKEKNIKDSSFYFHQWHELYEGVKKSPKFKKQLTQNMHISNYDFSIIRNKRGWGQT